MTVKIANNASSTLAGSITDVATTVTVQSGDAAEFPTPAAGEWFPVTIVDGAGNLEILKVTARSGADLTVVRGQEGTTGTAFASGSKISLRLTKAAIESLQAQTPTHIVGATETQLAFGGVTDALEVLGTTLATAGLALAMFSATPANAAHLDFYKSANATLGSATVVASGEALGKITWYGAQQTGTFATQNPAAQIRAEVDAAVTSGAGGDMPGRLVFSTTANASGTLTDRLILDSAGILKPNANDGVALGTAALSFSDLFLAAGGVLNWNNGDVTITHSTNALAFAGAASGYSFDAAITVTGILTINPSGSAQLFLTGGGTSAIEIGRVDGSSSTPLIDFHSGATATDYDTRLIASGGTGSSGGGDLAFDGGAFRPVNNDGAALGTAAKNWSDLFLAAAGVLNFANGDVTITHSTNALAFAGAANGYSFDASLLLATGTALNWNGGDVTVTHSANALAFAGAASGYTFDAAMTLAGDLTLSKANPAIILYKAASGQTNGIVGRTNGVNRWQLQLGDSLAESGSNAGSNFQLNGYDDGGTLLGTPFSIVRSTGIISIGNGLNPTINAGAALGSGSKAWSDLFIGATGTLNFNNGDVVVTHSTNALAFTGAANGYSFDMTVAIAAVGSGVGRLSMTALNTVEIGWITQNGLSAGTYFAASFRNGAGTEKGSITVTNTATAFNTSSDANQKVNFRDFDSGQIIDRLAVGMFDWRESPNTSGYGVLAQQAYEVFPDMITAGSDDAEFGTDAYRAWGADYSKLVPILLRETKQLRQRVAELEAA